MAEDRVAQLAEQIQALLQEGRLGDLRTLLAEHQPSEIAESFEDFPAEDRIRVLACLSTDPAVDVFGYLEEQDQMELLNRFRPQRQETFLREMEPDERADLFQALPEDLATKFLAMLPRAEKEEVRELVAYEPHTAGGLMTPEFASLSPKMTVAQAVEHFRKNYSDLEMVYYLYVLDSEQRLVGLVSMRQLLVRNAEETVESFMFQNVVSVLPNTDQEEVAQILTLYDFLAIPVVDETKKMLGIVTFDDVADVMSEEATEDLELLAAVLPSEHSYERTTVLQHIRRRAPWLVTLLIISSITGFVVTSAGHGFKQSDTPLFISLFALFPMLMAAAGNAGTQAATMIIRGIATGEIDPNDRWQVLRKECIIGLAIGLLLAAIGFVRAMIGAEPGTWLFLGLAVSGALILMLLIANVMGALLPLLFQQLGWDPALMSGPLIATLIDVLSSIVYFTVAMLVLAQAVGAE